MTNAISARPHKPIIGIALIIVCSLHCLQAIISGASIWTEAFDGGWIGAFRTPEHQMMLWFLFIGLVGLVAGIAIVVIERRRRLPWSVSASLALLGVLGVVAAPASGFWLVLAVALLALIRSAARPRVTEQPQGKQRRFGVPQYFRRRKSILTRRSRNDHRGRVFCP